MNYTTRTAHLRLREFPPEDADAEPTDTTDPREDAPTDTNDQQTKGK